MKPTNSTIPWIRLLAFAPIALVVFTMPGCETHRAGSNAYTVITNVPNWTAVIARADTLADLQNETKPDLSWTDDDGSHLFLWASQPEPGNWKFVIDKAHEIQMPDRRRWCFLDFRPADSSETQQVSEESLLQEFIRCHVDFPDRDGGDGNRSHVELLSTNNAGAALLKITYCSLGGMRANQEEVKSYLIYVNQAGKCQLVTRDLGHEGVYPHGSIGYSDLFEFKMTWRAQTDSKVPFEIKVRESSSRSVASADAPNEGYTTFRDGRLRGNFPMTLQMSSTQYLEADGKQRLMDVARKLVYYNSDWITADWIKPGDKPKIQADVTQSWFSELVRLNPKLPREHPIAHGSHIVIPDESTFGNQIYERFRRKIAGN